MRKKLYSFELPLGTIFFIQQMHKSEWVDKEILSELDLI